ncbi:MAG: hypothetical protein JJU13_06470 [Balneolaceae bacterium]|nr:hypothetical protein [Balneolaceae bacterium]
MKTHLKLITLIIFPFLVGFLMTDGSSDSEYREWNEFNPERLDGPFTGGFGEQTCHSCHFDYDLNMEGGSLSVDGLPVAYKPGREYNITVTVQSEHLENGGFQLTSRFEGGSQAGSFSWDGDRLKYTPNVSDKIKYLQHTREGTLPTGDRKVSWSFNWQAPECSDEDIIINIAANAGNDDDSAFGDWIYVKELFLKPE